MPWLPSIITLCPVLVGTSSGHARPLVTSSARGHIALIAVDGHGDIPLFTVVCAILAAVFIESSAEAYRSATRRYGGSRYGTCWDGIEVDGIIEHAPRDLASRVILEVLISYTIRCP